MTKSAAAGMIASLVAALCIAGAGAQERRLTLAEAINLAMAHNPALAVERTRHEHCRRRGHQGADLPAQS